MQPWNTLKHPPCFHHMPQLVPCQIHHLTLRLLALPFSPWIPSRTHARKRKKEERKKEEEDRQKSCLTIQHTSLLTSDIFLQLASCCCCCCWMNFLLYFKVNLPWPRRAATTQQSSAAHGPIGWTQIQLRGGRRRRKKMSEVFCESAGCVKKQEWSFPLLWKQEGCVSAVSGMWVVSCSVTRGMSSNCDPGGADRARPAAHHTAVAVWFFKNFSSSTNSKITYIINL